IIILPLVIIVLALVVIVATTATTAAAAVTTAATTGSLFDGLGRQIEDLIRHRPKLAHGRDDGDRDERAEQAVLDRRRTGPIAAQ
ncbi:MAG: hypothetical protein OEU46_20180, partial [Alphaproteobacteria bacterium]|nr:hypothetical protein [Alphaproteobacteria bacterium]